MFTIPLPSVYLYRCCDNCMQPYRFKELDPPHRGSYLDCEKYCRECTDSQVEAALMSRDGVRKSYFDFAIILPKELLDLKRIEMASHKIFRLELQDYHIELLNEITKTKDHESRTVAQTLIRNFARPEEREARASNG